MIRALIFDFDGLILETEGPVLQSWQELYQSFGCALSLTEWGKIIGTADFIFDPWKDLEHQVGQPLDWERLNPQRQARELELVALQPILPGVKEYLQAARRLHLKVGLASSSSRQWVTGHLNRLGLIDSFDLIRAREDVHQTKPDPELYLNSVTAFGLQPAEALAFEDSPNGITSAKRAGLFCVAVPNELTRLLPLEQADLQLASLAEMPLDDVLARINRIC